MKKSSAPNERIKREYFVWLKEAKGRNEASIDGVAKAIDRFETYTKFRDFKQFHIEQARGFKANLTEQGNARTSQPLSAATLYSTLRALKSFFKWLADRPGYKSRDLSCRCRVFQSLRKGDASGDGAPWQAHADHRTNIARSRIRCRRNRISNSAIAPWSHSSCSRAPEMAQRRRSS